MSIVLANIGQIQNAPLQDSAVHNLGVSLVGNRKDDEKKQNTLQDDVVTLSDKASKQQDEKAFKKLPKAIKAYMQNMDPQDPLTKENTESKLGLTDEEKKSKEQEELKQKGNDKKQNGEYLTDNEQKKLQSMKERDTEVRTHENAHKSAGGSYASAPQYEYKKGPDGKSYVTDGHVNIDVGQESTPEKTIQKMQVVIKAANAPAEPSSQDQKVAASARQKLNEAQQELAKQKLQGDDSNASAV